MQSLTHRGIYVLRRYDLWVNDNVAYMNDEVNKKNFIICKLNNQIDHITSSGSKIKFFFISFFLCARVLLCDISFIISLMMRKYAGRV